MINNFETGGSELQFTLLSKKFNAEQFDAQIGCIDRRGPQLDSFEKVNEFGLGGNLYGWRSWRTRFRLSGLLSKSRIQVAHAFDFYTNLTLLPAARLSGVPVIVASHRQIGDLLSPAKFRAQNAVFRCCDAIVCNSKAAADRLAAAGIPDKKLVVIGNALPPSAFDPVIAAVPRETSTLRVGMIARMNSSQKNHAAFLRIAANIHQRLTKVEFLLVGDGPLRPELERQAAALGISGCTTFLGNRRDIPALLASMDLTVLTSDSESLSNAILESMAAGLPVVAYDVGGNSEIVNNQRGSLIPPGDEGGFADAIQLLLSDLHLREQRGGNARRYVEENFSLDMICRKYEGLYRDLLEKKRGSNPAQ